MSQYLTFAVLGLGAGVVFASLAISLVVTYRGSGVINFAAGANALFGAYTYAFLRNGQLFIPIPGLRSTVSLGSPLSFWPSFLLALLLAAVLGLVEFVLIFRFLRSAPPMTRAAASIGLAVFLQAAFAMQAGTNTIPVSPFFPQGVLHIFGGTIPVDRFWITATLVVLTLLLVAVYKFTKFGLATEAVAESTVGAVVTGLSPDLIGASNWAISGAVAAVGGIMISPIVSIVPIAYSGFIVAALAAALAARFRSLTVALGIGLSIGVVQSEFTYLSARYSWLPRSGSQDIVPLIVILFVLVFAGQRLPARGGILIRNVDLAPRPRRPLATAAAATAVAIAALLTFSATYRAGLMMSMLLAIVALSFVVITGYAGQVSLAQLALAGAGGFLTSGLTTSWGVPFPFAPLLAAMFVAVLGVVIGLPALRLRGLNVAVVTLAFAALLDRGWFSNSDLNGGLVGARVAPLRLLGVNLSAGIGRAFPTVGFCLVCLVSLVACSLGVVWLRKSKLGGAMLAVRANERSAASSGVDVAKTKVVAFAVAAFIAGLGGALMAYAQGGVSEASYSVYAGLVLFAVVFVAGVNSISGALISGLIGSGGLLYVALSSVTTLGSWFGVFTGIALVLVMVIEPQGIAGMLQKLLLRLVHANDAAAPTGPIMDGVEVVPVRVPVGDNGGSARLVATGLSVHYGGVVAVDNVAINLCDGEIVGLLGPNGAGKTSLVDALSGLATAKGSILLDGVEISKLPAHQRARRGLSRTFQSLDLYEDLTVAENVRSGTLGSGLHGQELDAAVQQALEQLSITELADVLAANLSQGHRQLVSIARSIVDSPTLLLLDEPAAGLGTAESKWLGTRIRSLADTGMAILLIDHDMGLVRSVSDVVYVLAFGEVIASGDPESVYGDPAVAEAYLGSPEPIALELAEVLPDVVEELAHE